MSNRDGVDRSRRRLLVATTGLGVVGAAIWATPFVLGMTPSARAKAAGAPIEVDISKLKPGQIIKAPWQGKPVWVLRRTESMLKSLANVTPELSDPQSEKSIQPEYVDPVSRSIKPEILVLVGLCTHLGCSPTKKFVVGPASDMGADWLGGFYCPCHGSKFDMSGRVFKNVPAPTNLVVPPHGYKSSKVITVGIDQTKIDKKKGRA